MLKRIFALMVMFSVCGHVSAQTMNKKACAAELARITDVPLFTGTVGRQPVLESGHSREVHCPLSDLQPGEYHTNEYHYSQLGRILLHRGHRILDFM